MATVMALRVNHDQAVLVADESTWHLGHVFGYRRTNYGDALLDLVEPAQTEVTGLSAVYCGVGFPSMHDEAARFARRQLAEAGAAAADNDAAKRAAYKGFSRAHARLVDDKLRFDYGFDLAQLNARRYPHEGETRQISQPAVIAAARAVAGGSAQGNAYTRIFSNQGLVLSRDRTHGVQCWYLSPTSCDMGFATPMAVLGDGGALAGHLMAQWVERRDLPRRREGFTLREGLFVAMRIAAEVQGRVGSMGGYLQVMVLDGEAGVRQLVCDAAHVATEVLRAHLWGYLGRGDAEELVVAAVLEGADDAEVEAQLFERVGARKGELERCLMGFKPHSTPHAEAVDPPRAPGDGPAPPDPLSAPPSASAPTVPGGSLPVAPPEGEGPTADAPEGA